ncbi:MAG: FUPA24 P-type ATPase [uncultured Rubrobacteraceae bacterium]|uniref:P-type Cu(+) transporter n=1 Tax=uncultured Rubrobacteraceae bacterium TaxID=349277 RepID=A0A6J4QPL8_9ACTN|nr:MAG: FUPA24 P-type ATPase [uncultured Rubrobacteraceae bacterium]
MSLAVAGEPRVVHAIPGRMRVHLPGWEGRGPRGLEARLRRVQGVSSARANPLTGNVLIRFDPAATDDEDVLRAVREVKSDEPAGKLEEEPVPPPVQHERSGQLRRARIAMRGLDRDPGLARDVVEDLERRPGVVRASASPLTSRVLVEFIEHQVALEDLVTEVSSLELPAHSDEDRPNHPLDPEPARQTATRAAGAGLGLGLLATRRLAGREGPPTRSAIPIVTGGVVSILRGFPVFRDGLREILGTDTADLVFSATGIALQVLSGSPLGLALSAAEALRLFTEIRARRAAWRHYEEEVENAPPARPGAVIRLRAGERTPLAGEVIEGAGTATGPDGLPTPVAPGVVVPAGARLHGGPFVLELRSGEPFLLEPRSVPVVPSLYDRYLRGVGSFAFAYAVATALTYRSLSRAFKALLLINPRAAITGAEAADSGASARVLRSGVTVVGTRSDRSVRLPGVLLIDGPRVLTGGLEIGGVLPLNEAHDASGVLARAAEVSAAAGSPWGDAFRAAGTATATEGTFDGEAAIAQVQGVRYSLRPVEDRASLPPAARLRNHGDYLLMLGDEEGPLGIVVLRPRLAPGIAEMVGACRQHGVEVGLLAAGDPAAAQAVARRAETPLIASDDAVETIRGRQEGGALVAFVSDNANAAAAFAACDLAVGITDGRSHLPARADLLAPDLGGIAAILDAGARRDKAVRDSVALSAAADLAGAVMGVWTTPGVDRASYPTTVSALGAIAAGWARLRGGERPHSFAPRMVDPRPERWGQRGTADVLRALDTTEEGLASAEATERRRPTPTTKQRNRLLAAILDQIRSPLTGILAAGAGLSLALGATGDVAMIGTMIVANAAAGAWQERQADRTAETLERMGTVNACVLRDGHPATVSAEEVVPGDILLLAPGDRIAADARLLSAHGLEIDEAALTGESLPVSKAPDGETDAARIVLEGSDVVVGTGRAVAVAVGRDTRMGATAAALAGEDPHPSPLTARLNVMLRRVLPLVAAGGAIVFVSGLLRGRALLPQLAIGASIAVAAVPEGLPLLAKIGEAAVARRLAGRHALVRHLSAVEALGRVDVACTDKTGTLTEGRLALRIVADADGEVGLPADLPPGSHRVLLTAALAGPHPDASDAFRDPTDAVVSEAAKDAGFGDDLRVERESELPFDSARGFHANVVKGRLCVEGAAESLTPRCDRVRRDGDEHSLDEDGRRVLLAQARRLAERGLRVLMVAEGSPDATLDNPRGLVALGFLGISDPLRPAVPEAVRRCHDAGVRVVMLTGDHPSTARAIAREAGLPDGDRVLTGSEIAELDDEELDLRLERTTIVARVTPLDKLRIVESLQRRGHTVAMTGDGVNDAPALRLADVGVAMGRGGTEVARQTADVVLADDDFSTLVEALVEGRSFWRNIRRALGLLLGGNLGELGLEVGASVLGLASPLTTRQILAVNLVTDVLPALAVALQQPEHHDLGALSREGASALDKPLRNDILRRGIATAAPALAAYIFSLRSSGLAQARTVAFASIVATQLAQTLDAGRAEGGLSRSVLGAVAGSAGMLVTALAARPLRGFFGLAVPGPLGWILIGAGALVAILLGRVNSLLGLSPARAPVSASPTAGFAW